jgi:hypothetical protein
MARKKDVETVKPSLVSDEAATTAGGSGESVLPPVQDNGTPPPPPSPTDTPSSSVTDDEPVSTLTVPLTAAGEIAWSAVKRDATKERIRKAMGTAGDSLKRADEVASLARLAPGLWVGLGTLAAYFAPKTGNADTDAKIAAAFAYSQQELQVLAEPTAALIAKYAPADLGRWNEELTFAMVVLHVHAAKFAAVKALAKEAVKPNE